MVKFEQICIFENIWCSTSELWVNSFQNLSFYTLANFMIFLRTLYHSIPFFTLTSNMLLLFPCDSSFDLHLAFYCRTYHHIFCHKPLFVRTPMCVCHFLFQSSQFFRWRSNSCGQPSSIFSSFYFFQRSSGSICSLQ